MKRLVMAILLMIGASALAQTLTVPVYRTAEKGQGASIGTITFKDSAYGLLVNPALHGLTPGLHGLHIHLMPDCSNFGMNAGGHFDPKNTGKHLGPYNKSGHLGDLPALYVNKKGQAVLPTLAPRLRVRDLRGHSLMIHEGGDNYSDTPEKLGGGGKRIACGVIPSAHKGSAKK